jgi:hypothetical protein
MRARRREINIFNMSLLDILCGALGAFCFMMLVALPYYKPSRSDAQLRENQEKTQELMRDIEKLKERLSDPESAADLEDLLRRLQAQIQALQGQVNQLTAENQQLKDKNEELTAKNDKQKRLIDQKRPFLTVVTAVDQNQGVDMYLQDDMAPEGGGKSANPAFDPSMQRHTSRWQNDQTAFLTRRGVAMWVTSDVPPSSHFKIYAKLANEVPERKSTEVVATIFGDIGEKGIEQLPVVTLTPERFWEWIGTVVVDDNNKLIFIAATSEQRDAEWKAISKSVPPVAKATATAATVASPTATASVTSAEERRALLEKMRKEREQHQQTSPTATASSPTGSAEERRALIEKMRKEREQQQSSPASARPSASPVDQRREMLEKLRQDRQSQPSPTPSVTP